MWVERLADESIATSRSEMFATAWPGFHKDFRGPSLMTLFTGSPASGWTRNFRLDYIERESVQIISTMIFMQVITLS